MARVATIIDTTTDAHGDRWDVRERREGPGFAVMLGWPCGVTRGKGGGGPRVIPITPLVEYMHAHCQRGGLVKMERELPIGRTAIKRLRRVLGLDQHRWWADREHDLATLTGVEFARRHNVTEGAASMARQRYLGISRQRPDGWWREPVARDLLLSDRARTYIADQLDISIGAVGRLRWMLRQD